MENAIKSSRTWKEVLKKIGIKSYKSSCSDIKRIASVLDYDFSHFKKVERTQNKEQFIEFLAKTTSRQNGPRIIPRLIKFGIRNNYCEECGQEPMWNNKVLTLQLDHIDGNPYNNNIDNLRILCPNCHSQCDTSKSGGKGAQHKCQKCKTKMKRNGSGMCKVCQKLKPPINTIKYYSIV